MSIYDDMGFSAPVGGGGGGGGGEWPDSVISLDITDTLTVSGAATFEGDVIGLTKTMVALDQVDNTSDANKPVSTAQQSALDAKVAKAGDTMTGALNLATGSGNGLIFGGDTNLYRSAADTLKTDDSLVVGGARLYLNTTSLYESGGSLWTDNELVVATQQVLGAFYVIRGATSTQAVLTQVTGDSAPRLRITADGKHEWGPGNAGADTNLYRPTGTPDTLKTDDSFIVGGGLTVTGAVTGTGFTKTLVGLSNVDNTSDANKPVSTATQTALDLKAPLASPTFTGTVSGITKSMVGLTNVDDTSDADKPVSTAAQAALDLKAPLASPTFTGTSTFGAPAGWSIYAPNSNAGGHGIYTRAGATGNYLFSGGVYSDANTRMTIEGSGRISIGDGSGSRDTNLYRSAADTLKTDDSFIVGADLTVTGTVTGAGFTKTLVGLSNVDNTSDANKPVSTAQAAADALKLSLTGGTMSGTIAITKTAGNAVTARVTGDAQARLLIGTDGKLTLGDGTAVGDTTLYRAAADTLKTDDALQIVTSQAGVFACTVQNTSATGHGLSLSSGGSTNFGFGSTVVGDNFYRYIVDCAGKIQWGDGTNAVDTALYRSAADTLKTDDSFIVGAGVLTVQDINLTRTSSTVLQCDKGLYATNNMIARSASGQGAVSIGNVGAGSTAGILFGTDTNLYRLSADTLRTDDTLVAGAGFQTTSITMSAGITDIVAATSTTAHYLSVSGDTYARMSWDGTGKITWGSGAGAGDTTLYRSAADTLKTDDTLIAGAGLLTVGSTAAGSTGLTLHRLASGVTANVHLHVPAGNSPTYQTVWGGTWSGESAGSINDTFAFYQSAVPAAQTMTFGRINLGAAGAFTSSDMGARLTITATGVRVDNHVGFYGATPAAKPAVTGSRGANAAVASLLTALAGLGLITDSSSA